jgi:hypothetical protein
MNIQENICLVTPEQYIRRALFGLDVEPSNIRYIVPSRTRFQQRPDRYAVIFYRSPGLSAIQVNAVSGLSNAVFNGCNLVVDAKAVQP